MSRGVRLVMGYPFGPELLDYSRLEFISTSIYLPQAKIWVDLDQLFDEVSSEIFALFVGEQNKAQVQAAWN